MSDAVNTETSAKESKNYAGLAVIPSIGADKFKLAEYAEIVWHAVVPEGVTPEDLTRPDFWAHVASRLTAGAIIHVDAEDRSWYAHGKVLDADRTWAKVDFYMVRHVAEVPEKGAEDDEFAVRFIPASGFRVIRKSDRALIKEGLASKAEALTYIKNYRKALAA
jgi:spermidine synthase